MQWNVTYGPKVEVAVITAATLDKACDKASKNADGRDVLSVEAVTP